MVCLVLTDFFRLNDPVAIVTQQELRKRLRNKQTKFQNLVLEPNSVLEWEKGLKFEGLEFTNFSFSRCTITKAIFKNCTFRDCLFLGTLIEDAEFHGCKFENCNFNKAKLRDVYAKPEQFEAAVQDEKHANVGVWLYQQLRNNYDQTSQREFHNAVEFRFQTWRRKEEYYLRKKRPTNGSGFAAWFQWIFFWPAHVKSRIYGAFFGYGYSWWRLLATSSVAIAIMSVYNGQVAQEAFSLTASPSNASTVYFTIATMLTLGAFGFDPKTQLGYIVVLANALVGVILISALLGSLVGRLSR